MEFNLEHAIDLLKRTPRVLRAMFQGLPAEWATTNKGEKAWSAFLYLRLGAAGAMMCLANINETIAQDNAWSTVPTITPHFTRIIHSDSIWIGLPDISPDNRWIAYAAESWDSASNIWLVAAKGGTPIRLTSGKFVDIGPIWFPTSDRIVFASNRPAAGAGGPGYLMILSVDPRTGLPIGSPRQLTENRVGGFGAPSPDGNSVAYPSATKDGVSRVMVVSSSGGVAREIASHKADWARTGPEFLWSSDGRWIFHVLRRAGAATNVFNRVSASDGAAQELAVLVEQIAHPDQTRKFVLLRIGNDTGASTGPPSLRPHGIATINMERLARFAAPRRMWIFRFTADGRSLIAQQADSSGYSLWRLDIGDLLRAPAGDRR